MLYYKILASIYIFLHNFIHEAKDFTTSSNVNLLKTKESFKNGQSFSSIFSLNFPVSLFYAR